MSRIKSNNGYTLIEIVVVIIIIGIITSVTLKSLRSSGDISRVEETKKELDKLAFAIIGQPDLKNGGVRTNYGYLGDNGSLPPNLDALYQNPGGFSTWRGPYIRDDFSSDGSSSEFKKDAWGENYNYSGGNVISSNGGGSVISRQLAPSLNKLLYNKVTLVVSDLDKTPPGTVFKDSLRLVLKYPNGHGSYVNKNLSPDHNGLTEFDSIPVGLHELKIIYLPENDTLIRKLNVDMGVNLYSEITLFKDTW